MLRNQERPVSRNRRQRDLDQVILRATREKQQSPCNPSANDDSTQHFPREQSHDCDRSTASRLLLRQAR